MIAVLFLIGAALLGMVLVRRAFGTVLSGAEQSLWGLVVGWCLTGLAVYGVALTSGRLTYFMVALTTAAIWIGVVAFYLPLWRKIRRADYRQQDRAGLKSLFPLAILLLVFAPVYFSLFDTHMLPVGTDGGLYSGGGSTSYDIAFHAALTNSFVHGDNFPPLYPPMPPAPLLYPALPDFFTAILVVAGLDLHVALVWTAVPLALALTGLFYFFALRLFQLDARAVVMTERRMAWAAVLAAFLFFVNGGLGFLDFLRDWLDSGERLWTFAGHLPANYSHLPEKQIVWPNLVTDMLLPQRTALFGMGLGLLVLSCFAIGRKEDRDWKFWFAAGCLAGVLPFFHLHSYAAVGFVSLCLFLLKPQRTWVAFWLPALIIALPHFVGLGTHLSNLGLMRFQPGWRGNGTSNWGWFWIRNAGLPTLLIIPAWWTASRSLRLFYLPFAALLIAALLVVFSPNDYDNLKLMAYWQAVTSVVLAARLARIAKRTAGIALASILIFGSTFSGVLSLIYEAASRQRVFTAEEVAVAKFVTMNTTPHALFLAAPTLHQPVLSLAGRSVVRGPTAWLWSHGYPFAEREADVRAIYAGRADAAELLRYYRVDYVYLGEHEHRELKANQAFFDATLPIAYQQDEIRIYDARALAGGSAHPDRLESCPVREYSSRIERDPSQMFAEFPAIAYRLYCLRKAAFGETPRYPTFIEDLQQLGKALFPRTPGWQETLARNERSLVDRWQRDERTVQETATRLAKNRDDFDAAFVLCHYFAFLKRDPDQPPDHDLSGYQHWLRQLARTGDYRGVTRAFIESDEYKRRLP